MEKLFINDVEQDTSSVEIEINLSGTPDYRYDLVVHAYTKDSSVPDEPTDPPTEPDQPPVEPPTDTSLLLSEASTMSPGEWRNLEAKTNWEGKDTGDNFKLFQRIKSTSSTADTDGFGWTQPLVYSEQNDCLGWLCCRGTGYDQALITMDSAGNFTKQINPVGFSIETPNGGRRPFHRLFSYDNYLCFAPINTIQEEMGRIIRTPLDNPGVFELVGPAFNDSQVDTAGAFAMTYFPKWGRLYAYTPGGKIWSRAPEDDSWFLHGRLQRDTNGIKLSGFAGMLLANPIKDELLIVGGQEFGDNEQSSYKVYVIKSPFGDPEMLADRRLPSGELKLWDHGQSKCLVHPEDGSYLFFDHETDIWYRTVTGGGTMHLFDDVSDVTPLGKYEAYTVFSMLPNTDVYAFVSHTEGLGLWRPYSVEIFPSDPEDDPINVPTPTDPTEPPTEPPQTPSDAFEDVAASVQQGTMVRLSGVSHSPGTTFKDFWMEGNYPSDKDTYGPQAFWDPDLKKIIYPRDRTPGSSGDQNYISLKIFDAATKSWSLGATIDGHEYGSGHPWGQQAYDVTRKDLYYKPLTSRVVSWDSLLKSWLVSETTSSKPVESIAPCCWHEDLDMLIRPQAQEKTPFLMGLDPDSEAWRVLAPLNHQAYQSMLHYNPIKQNALLLGGSDNRTKVTLINADGSITYKNDIPTDGNGLSVIDTNINWSCLFHDPESGDYLLKTGANNECKFWQYNIELDEWRLAVDFSLPENQYMNPGNYYGWVMVPIDKLGVIARATVFGLDIYRHKSVF